MTKLGSGLSVLAVFAVTVFLGIPAVGRGEEAPRTASAVPARPEWGTKDRILQHVGFSEFSPDGSSTTYGGGGLLQRFSTSGIGFFWAIVHIPSGALLQYLELDYCDESTTDDVLLHLWECNFLGLDCAPLETLISSDGPSGCGFVTADLSGLAYTMNNNTRAVYLYAITESGDSTTALQGAYLGYKLQVSTPSPGMQTFGDVPPSHAFHRVIEALAAAGITSGCGGGNFCPERSITRAEVAAFLAKALGLHFPN